MKNCVPSAYILALLPVIICILVFPVNAQADVITVCPAGCNFTNIQDAINYAADGDTIQVMSGSYNEVIEINKSVNLTGIASSGGYPHIGKYTMPVAVTVNAPGVTFEGFDIHGEGEHAIDLKASHITVRNVTVGIHRPVYEGDAIIEGTSISDITIADCTMQSTGGYGIYFLDSQDLAVERNYIIVNNQSTEVSPKTIGAVFSRREAEYSGFRFEDNAVIGGPIESSIITGTEKPVPSIHDILIRNNTVSGSIEYGIKVGDGWNIPWNITREEIVYPWSDIAILDNTVSGYDGRGITVWCAGGGLVSGNQVKNLHDDYFDGITLGISTRLEVLGNTISDCTGEEMVGLVLYDLTASRLSGNVMDRNTYNFDIYSPGTTPGLDIDQTNLADGRPFFYYEGRDHISLDGDVANGAVYYFVNCRDVSATRLTPSRMGTGISFTNCQDVSITHSSVEHCITGIMLSSSPGSMVSTSRLADNGVGIELGRCNNSMVWQNEMVNGIYGILMYGSNPDLRVSNNSIRDNNHGILYYYPAAEYMDITFDGNEILGNNRGVTLQGTKGLAFTNNVIGDSTGTGIWLQDARDTTFRRNQVRNNSAGMKIESGASGSSATGNNTFVDNYFNNFNQVIFITPDEQKENPRMDTMKGSPAPDEIKGYVGMIGDITTSEVNHWNVTKTAGTNIAGGPYLGGNYWAKPDGTGWSQVTPDRGDGFCNAPFVIDANNTDYLPLHTYTPQPYDYNLTLGEGWNLVSVPKTLAPGYDTGSIFKDVVTEGRTIWEYNGVIHNWVPIYADTQVLPLYGFWIYSKSPTTVPLKFDPNPLQVPPTRNIVKGWELIGFTGTIPASARDTLISVRDTWTQAMGFDTTAYHYDVQIIRGGSGQFSDSRLMNPTKGYWLFMTGPGDLSAIGA